MASATIPPVATNAPLRLPVPSTVTTLKSGGADGDGNATIPRPLDYRWAHAVNSWDQLEAILQHQQDYFDNNNMSNDGNANYLDNNNNKTDTTTTTTSMMINAIEADIIYSEISNGCVMGHPPQTDNDLSLREFLERLTQVDYQRKCTLMEPCRYCPGIVKLDFKSQRAFDASASLLETFVRKSLYPEHIFLNADLVQGPCPVRSQFHATGFITNALRIAPQSVLSIGWTTSSTGMDNGTTVYTKDMIREMKTLLLEATAMTTPTPTPRTGTIRVTFPVKATYVQESWENLRDLLLTNEQQDGNNTDVVDDGGDNVNKNKNNVNNNYGLTLWYGEEPPMSTEQIDWIYNQLENTASVFQNRTYYDISGMEEYLQWKETTTI